MSASNTIGVNEGIKQKGIRGWNKKVREARDKAILWHNIWKENDRPKNGIIFEIRKNTRSDYHKAIKELSRENNMINKNKIAHALSNGQTNKFWTEIKKVNHSKCLISSAMDGTNGDSNVCNVFKVKFSSLYTSVPSDLNELSEEVSNLINIKCKGRQNGSRHLHEVTITDVKIAAKKLRKGKCKTDNAFMSDCIINGSDKLLYFLSKLFTSMISHGYAPDRLNISMMCPIPKNMRKALDDSNNYRAISLNSIMGKLFDNVLLNHLADYLNDSECQFAYKKDASTNLATFAVTQTIEYYRKNKTPVYAVFLDATKAFDKIEYKKLFDELIKADFCPLIVRLLINMYANNKACVKWNESKSDLFPIENGVKQGGVLSPQLFCFYMNPLIKRLHNSGYGCYVGRSPACVFSYADDLILLAPTRTAAQKMLNICNAFGEEYKITFNPDKCSVMLFKNGKESTNSDVFLGNKILKYVNIEKYLGHWLKNEGDIVDPSVIIRDIGVRANAINRNFKHLSTESKIKLYNSCCLSLYGCEIWNLFGNDLKKAEILWRVWARRICGINERSHNTLIPGLVGTPSLREMVESRELGFLRQCLQSKNSFVKKMTINCILETNYMSKNFNYLLCKYGINIDECMLISKNSLNSKIENKREVIPYSCIFLKELLNCRENIFDCNLSTEEINLIIEFICTK